MLDSLRVRLDQLARMEADPKRTAAALAIGVFLSFSPFLGLQILLGIAVAFALKLSRVAVLVGLCANLPWIMLPWYAVTTAAAAAMLGASTDLEIRRRIAELLNVPFYQAGFWGRAGDLVAAFVWPFVIGPTLGALGLGLATYVVGRRLLSRRQERLKAAAARASTGPSCDAQERTPDRHVGDSQGARLQP
jgi:uncharacterized protein (DUF2062 family)